ncbi:hypothetical protein HHK36_004057 [Tetracentron sinense]|uniref:J domain-containing protein n=1 Tax=Tetracentron sinense TaxID=13715 RepID=A0A834ZU46_TETSI|nr:hypothetical protein HHK36_004057 [Tetracentron sinense]
MEISLYLNPKIEIRMVPDLYRTRSLQKHCRLNTISCRASNVSMKKGRNTFYEVLSLDSEYVGFDEIKKAYRRMALQYHPDVCPPSTKEESTRRFVELQKAYETLSDPISREKYDYELGLVDFIEFGIGGLQREESRSRFPKEVWENQLRGLQRRCRDRMERKKNGCI